MKKNCHSARLFALWLLCFSGVAYPAQFYVAPNGNDANPGTSAKPFATFARAQEAVRGERKLHPDQAVKVVFRKGIYALEKTLRFTAEDSGASATRAVQYAAEAEGQTVLSGGKTITGWERDSTRPGVWKAKVDPQWQFEQLWVNGRRAVRARSPNHWEFGILRSVTEEPTGGDGGRQRHTFQVDPQFVNALKGLDPAALKRVQVLVFHKWDTTREWVESASPEQGVFTTTGGKMQSWNKMEKDCLFFLENSLSMLDAPGEWFLSNDGWVYYRPQAGEEMSQTEVIAPHLERFLEFEGTGDTPESWIRHISFEGLKFQFSEMHVPDAGLPPAQATMNVSATAVQVDGAQDIRFSHCAVEHIGSTAFWFRHACRDCRVEHTRMFDLGIGGVRIGEPGIAAEPVRTRGITVENCIIQSGGRLMPHTVAVWIGHNPENTIRHCDIGDWFYTGVSVGWRWGYAESAAKTNAIEFNHIHHLGYRILSDMGGVYTLGPSEGTVVRNNVIHDVYSTRYGGWGLYPDEGSTGILFENNVVYDVRDGCVHQHYGKENIFRNNILAFSEEGQIAVTRAEPHLSFTFERNLVYWDEGRLLGYAGWKNGAKVVLKNNLYWRADGKPFDFEGKSWDNWRAKGNDEGSIIADPLFVNPGTRDFHLRAGSPAARIGFRPFDFSQAGIQGDARWRALAASTTYPRPYVVPSSEPKANR